MGLFKWMKDMAEVTKSAKQLQEQQQREAGYKPGLGGSDGPDGGHARPGERAARGADRDQGERDRLLAEGIDGQGVIVGMGTPARGAQWFNLDIDLEVHVSGREAYRVANQYMVPASATLGRASPCRSRSTRTTRRRSRSTGTAPPQAPPGRGPAGRRRRPRRPGPSRRLIGRRRHGRRARAAGEAARLRAPSRTPSSSSRRRRSSAAPRWQASSRASSSSGGRVPLVGAGARDPARGDVGSRARPGAVELRGDRDRGRRGRSAAFRGRRRSGSTARTSSPAGRRARGAHLPRLPAPRRPRLPAARPRGRASGARVAPPGDPTEEDGRWRSRSEKGTRTSSCPRPTASAMPSPTAAPRRRSSTGPATTAPTRSPGTTGCSTSPATTPTAGSASSRSTRTTPSAIRRTPSRRWSSAWRARGLAPPLPPRREPGGRAGVGRREDPACVRARLRPAAPLPRRPGRRLRGRLARGAWVREALDAVLEGREPERLGDPRGRLHDQVEA